MVFDQDIAIRNKLYLIYQNTAYFYVILIY